jgi:hypothetical protein
MSFRGAHLSLVVEACGMHCIGDKEYFSYEILKSSFFLTSNWLYYIVVVFQDGALSM